MLIIGSLAMRIHGIDCREPKDIDIIGNAFEFEEYSTKHKDKIKLSEVINQDKHHFVIENIGHVEWDFAWVDSLNQELIDIVYQNNLHDRGYANLDVLYTLKMSHRYRRNFKHFKKTLDDIRLLESHGAKIPDCLKEWFVKREQETYNTHRPNLKQSKKDFFNTEGVTYKYDHDTLHLAVKRFESPCYDYFKEDLAEVFCSKDKFFDLPEEYKLGSVVEESLVLALERCLVPYNFNTPPNKAFLMALEKVCTSISSGWWREYAYNHYYEAIELYKEEYSNYVEKFLDGLHSGVIKLHK